VQPGRQNTFQPYLGFKQAYIPRGQNDLECIFKDHFEKFKEQYDEKYAKTYGNYRIDRITKVLFKTLKYNEYFKENFKVFDVLDFIALVTAHIPPKHNLQLR